MQKQSQTKNQYSTVRKKLADIYGVDCRNEKGSVSMHTNANTNTNVTKLNTNIKNTLTSE